MHRLLSVTSMPRNKLLISLLGLGLVALANLLVLLEHLIAAAGFSILGAAALLLWSMSIPARIGEIYARTRLVCEAISTGALAAMSVWILMSFVSDFDSLSRSDYAATATVVGMLGIAWASFISVAVRDRDHNIGLATFGIMVMVTGNNLWLMLKVGHHGGEWLGWVLIVVGLGIMGWGMFRACQPRGHVTARTLHKVLRVRNTAASIVYLGFAIVTLFTMLSEEIRGLAPLVLGGVGIVGLIARDFVRTLQDDNALGRYRDAALVDQLTGLGNRRAMTERFGELRHQPQRCPVAVIAFDIDRFKDVNQIMGHLGGDKLLSDVATTLRRVCTESEANLRSSFEPFRAGGDEFFVLALNATERECRLMAEEVMASVQQMSGDQNRQGRVSFSLSIGMVHRTGQQLHEWASDPMVLITQAGAALARAKAHAKDKVATYSIAMEQGISRRVQVETRLRQAIANRSLEPYFQPIVDLSSQQISGFEVLARWRDEDLGNVSPLEFVAIAEAAGIIADVDHVIADKAIENFAACGAADLGIDLWLNVSILELRSNAFENRILAALSRYGVSASQLVIEVTESVFVNTDDIAVRGMTRLSDYGIRVAIDDFGTGYSGIGYLDRLPVHILKVDKSFTSNLIKPETRAVTKAIIDMANAHHLVVVIEGIETDVAHRHARFLQANLGQGWFFASPLAPDRVTEFIREWQRQHPTWDSFRKVLGPDSYSRTSVNEEFTLGLFAADPETSRPGQS
ncbi:bifunctional diguanylate cyclase/phosphodiesterase [Micrococcales bacterium 31B]|nr:bifunctional diguanylate cyclase/phosphodiesterase [Micrococcales bacterium 31B]